MLGYGLGLRIPHYDEILETLPSLDWFEVISENFMDVGGRPRRILRQIREHYPVVLHGVSASLGSKKGPTNDYLNSLKRLADEIQPEWVSDHLCWTKFGKHHSHDLLPIPYTKESVRIVTENILRIQDFLNRPFIFENVSSYIEFNDSIMTEWEFIGEIIRKTGAGLLLDVNNIYVSSKNHEFDAHKFVDSVPRGAVKQIHLAGHSKLESYLLDTHDAPVIDPVWKLYEYSIKIHGLVPTMIERDDKIPSLKVLLGELNKARRVAKNVYMKRGKVESRKNPKCNVEVYNQG